MSERQTVLLRNYYERDIAVDDVTGEARMPVRVRRFSPAQFAEFDRGWRQCQNPEHERAIYRTPDEVEQRPSARSGEVEYVIPYEEIRRRRLAEMTDDERAAFQQAARAHSDFVQKFCCDQITAHVWVGPGAKVSIEDEAGDARPVKTGADIVAVFAGNFDTVIELTAMIYAENHLGAEKKRAWRQRSGSSSSSPQPTAATGSAPAETVAPAEPPTSAMPVDASVPSTEPSPSSVTA